MMNNSLVTLAVFICLSLATFLFCSLYRRQKRKATLAILEKDKLIQAFDEIIQSLSHEMNNSLTAILGSVELISRLQSDKSLLARIERSISQIKSSVKRIDALTRDLIILVKIERGQIELRQEEVIIRELITEALECFQPLALVNNLQLGHMIHTDCPQLILVDKEKIIQVLNKLMDNAFKFTNQGGVCLEVSGKGCQIQFQLRDTGVGIHKEHLAKIFDRFWQAKEFAYQGKGPGLTIAKGIVEAHKGKMWAESTYDQGSSIYFTLPV